MSDGRYRERVGVMSGPINLDDQMAEAIQRQRAHVVASYQVDRRGWTRQQWIDDARSLFKDLDGSVLDLVNGHISAMLAEIDGVPDGQMW